MTFIVANLTVLFLQVNIFDCWSGSKTIYRVHTICSNSIVAISNFLIFFWLKRKLRSFNNDKLKEHVLQVKKQFAFFNVSFILLVILDLCWLYVRYNHVIKSVQYQKSLRTMYSMLNLLPVIYVLIGQAKTIRSQKAT